MKSFDSIENFLEERLDHKRRTISESTLKEYDRKKEQLNASKIFQIEFSESIPEEIKSYLCGKLKKILDFPEKYGMYINANEHLLRFVDKKSYEVEEGTNLAANVLLPASKIKYISTSRSFIVIIILPQIIDTAETVINITRNLFSKLYGNIFLNEKILPMEFYRQNSNLGQKTTAAIPEILDLASKLNLSSETFYNHCEKIAKSYRLTVEEKGNEIRKQLISEWRKKWQEKLLTKEDVKIIDLIFSEFMDSMSKNPEKIINIMIEHVKKLNSQLHYILPHETREYETFEKKYNKHYLRSVQNKFQEITSLTGFIEELYTELNNFQEDSELKGIRKEILSKMQQLRKEKKIIQFYVPEIGCAEELKDLRETFPLILIKMIPKGTPLKYWSKTVKKMEKNYSESIYSKIYLALHSLNLLTLDINNSNNEFINKNETIKRLERILKILKYHSTEIKTSQSVLGIIADMSEQTVFNTEANKGEPRMMIPLNEFERAWSYFISFVLTLIYYQDDANSTGLTQGFNPENYTKSILGYVDKQCALGINYFHIVKLLWLIYKNNMNQNSIKFLLFCLENPNTILRFILHQIMRPQSGTLSLERRLEKLLNYEKAWVSAFQNRLDITDNYT